MYLVYRPARNLEFVKVFCGASLFGFGLLRPSKSEERSFAAMQAGVSVGSLTVKLAPSKEASMLVLSRQDDETIMIGDDIEITVVDIRGDKVRLGITAPTKIAIHRKEVWAAIKREREAARGEQRESGADSTPETPGAKTSGLRAPEASRRLYGGWRRKVKVRKPPSW